MTAPSRVLSSRDVLRWTAIAVPWCYLAAVLVWVLAGADESLWDFLTCYHGARALALGMNPYDWQTIANLAQQPVYPFVYTPLSFLLFAPLSSLSYAAAKTLALLFYASALFVALALCYRRMLPGKHPALFSLFAVLAFNGAIGEGFRTGNVSSLETGLVLIAVLSWAEKRRILFLFCIFAASLFKLTPLFFLCLVLFDRPVRWKHPAFGTVLFTAALLLSFRWVPLSFLQWYRYLGGVLSWEGGVAIPSSYFLLRDALALVGGAAGATAWTVKTAFGIAAATVLFFSARAGLRLARGDDEESRRLIAVLALLCYGLVMFRLASYALALMVPPVFFALALREYGRTIGPLMVLALIPRAINGLPGSGPLLGLLANYAPIITVFGAWVLIVLPANSSPAGFSAGADNASTRPAPRGEASPD